MRKVVIVATVAAASASPLLPGDDPSKIPEKLDKEDKDQFGPGGPLIPPMCQDNKKYTSPVEMGVLNSMWKKNSDSDCLGFLFFDQDGPAKCENPRYVSECGYTEANLAEARKSCPASCLTPECQPKPGDVLMENLEVVETEDGKDQVIGPDGKVIGILKDDGLVIAPDGRTVGLLKPDGKLVVPGKPKEACGILYPSKGSTGAVTFDKENGVTTVFAPNGKAIGKLLPDMKTIEGPGRIPIGELQKDGSVVKDCTSYNLGGDPIFKTGDQWLKFHLKVENELIPILEWTQPSGRRYTLLGSTFSSRMKGSDQWFNKLAVKADDKQVLVVEIGALHDVPPERMTPVSKTMRVRVDGKHMEKDSVYTHDGKFQVTLHERPFKPAIGENKAERVRLHWGHGFEFEISSAAAIAFPKHPDLQEKWAHLNVHFDHLPSSSNGLLAELAGIKPKSHVAMSMLSKPSKPSHSPLREHGVSLRHTAKKSSDSCPMLCPGCPLAWNCEVIANIVDLYTFWADENDDFKIDVDEFESVCENSLWLKRLFDPVYPKGCKHFANTLFALCDADESGDLDGCEGFSCVANVENEYRGSKCPGFPLVEVEKCSADDCIYGLKPEYETLFPSFKGCAPKPLDLPDDIDWPMFQDFNEGISLRRMHKMSASQRIQKRYRAGVITSSPYNATHFRNFFQAILDKKNLRNIIKEDETWFLEHAAQFTEKKSPAPLPDAGAEQHAIAMHASREEKKRIEVNGPNEPEPRSIG